MMFLGFPFVALICLILAAVMVFGIAIVYSPACKTDARDFSLISERIQGRFSIFRRVDSFDFDKIRGKVMLTMSEQRRVITPDWSVAPKYGTD